jgi:hypothetical protein
MGAPPAGPEALPGRAPEAVGGGAHIQLVSAVPRLAQEYERLCATSEAYIYAAMSRLMLRRLARA